MAASAMLALPPAAAPRHRRSTTLAALLLGTAGTMVIGGLIAAFLAVDGAVEDFPPADLAPDNYTAVTLMITLAMVSAFAEWAVYALRQGERGHALMAYGLSLGLALAGGNALWYLASRFPFGAVDHLYGTLVYAMVAAVAAFLFLATGFLLFAFFRVLGGQADAPDSELPRAAAAFWHLAVVGYFGVFATLYLFNLMFK
jgi:heme/copper-type cytochrome/quinol oxidase subunit 3